MPTSDPKQNPSSAQPASATAPFPEAPLPVEPSSGSELLASTHVFAVEIRAAQPTPWVPGEGGLSSRKVAMQVALGEVLKGSFPASAGGVFPLEIEQHRQRNPFGDHPGLWSRLDAEPGARYVLASRGTEASSPADLMREPAILRVLPGDATAEVHLARGAERALQDERRAREALKAKDPEAEGARAAAVFGAAHVAAETDVFGRYLWARVQPTFLRSPERPTREIATLLTTPGASRGLRLEIVAGLDAVAPALGSDLEFVRPVATAYAALLLDPATSADHFPLVEVSLYFLLTPGDKPHFASGTVFPDPAERARLRRAIEAFSSDRARKLASWLAG